MSVIRNLISSTYVAVSSRDLTLTPRPSIASIHSKHSYNIKSRYSPTCNFRFCFGFLLHPLKVSPIKAFNAVPRFGHTSDITSIYNDGGLDMVALTDYAQGTVFVAGFCLAAFIIWILLLLILKCFGRRVGILAGHPFEEDSYMRSTPGKHTGFRSFMLMSSLIISMCGIIFLVRGARSVTNVFDDIRDGAAVSLFCSVPFFLFGS